MSAQSYGFYISQWKTEHSKILGLRHTVLVDECGVDSTAIEETDDPDCFHVIAYDGESNPIGAGCMSKKGAIRHIVVLRQWRRRTVGKAIVLYLLNIAKIKNLSNVIVKSPASIIGFFHALDFENTDVVETIHRTRYQTLIRLVTKPKSILH